MRYIVVISILLLLLPIPTASSAQAWRAIAPGTVVRFARKTEPPTALQTQGSVQALSGDSLIVRVEPAGDPRAVAVSDLRELWIRRASSRGMAARGAAMAAIPAAVFGMFHQRWNRLGNETVIQWATVAAAVGALVGRRQTHVWWEPVFLPSR
jgi:hypothetical protein